jgi:hypothetical protein
MTMPADLPMECRAVWEHLAELALGVLPGRARVATLAHLDSCARCRDEVERLSLAADGVLRATPRVEPPEGFEQRVLARMVPGHERRRLAQERQRRQRRLVLSLAAAVVALAVPLGLSLSSGGGAPAPVAAGMHASAPLVSDGRVVGRVSTYYGHGHQSPWLSMTLHGTGGNGVVHCQVTVRGGAPITVGSFWVESGTGQWDSPLPVPADEVTGARVLGPGSTVLATARLTT